MSSESTGARNGITARIVARPDRVLAFAILCGLIVKFILIARISVNWDEFYFLELTHQYVRGDLANRFQTFHVHLFSWLPRSGWDQFDQVLAARAVMQIMAVGSALLTYGIARRFLTRNGALFAVLAYLSFSAVIEHGASFRVDPMVTFLSLLSLFAILCRPGGIRGAACAGAAMALGMLLTIKSAFYLVIIVAVFWCDASNMRYRLKLGIAFGISFLAAGAALYLFHGATLAPQSEVGAGAFLRSSASKVFFDGLFPRAFDLISLLIVNPLFWLMLIQGAGVAWKAARNPENRSGWHAWLPLVLALPVLTATFYRNAFSYFYPFILPSAAILVGLAFEKNRRDALRPNADPGPRLIAVLVVLQCFVLFFGSISKLGDKILVQRQTVAEIRAVFPEPAAYVEGFGILSDYPRTGFFMSSWGVETYRRLGKPVFADLVAKYQPAFMIADSPSLYGAMVPGVQVDKGRTLLPEDSRFLQESYVRHWGMLFVAGKHFRSADGGKIAFSIAVSGEYRLEAAGPAVIDGNRMRPGGVVALAAGAHAINFGGQAGEATLRWAKAAHVPELAPTDPLTFFHRKAWAGMTHQMMRPDASR